MPSLSEPSIQSSSLRPPSSAFQNRHDHPLPTSLRTNFRWTLAGSLVYALCQWGMLSVLAKQGTAGTVGTFALALAIVSPIFIFTNLTLRAVQVTDTERKYCFAEYFTLRVFTTLIGLAAVVTVTVVMHPKTATQSVVVLVAIARAVECISDILGGHYQTEERLDLAAVSQMARGVLSWLGFSGAFLLSHSLTAASAALAAAWLAVLVAYDLPRARALLTPGQPFFAFNWPAMRRLARLSLPLGLVMLLVSLNGNLPRYLLEHHSGPAQLGIFASLAYLLVGVGMVVNALGQSAIVRLSARFASGDLAAFNRLLLQLVAVGVLVTVIALPLTALLGRPLLLLFYRPEYAAHLRALLVMVAAAGVGAVASFLGYGLTATRCFNAQLPLTGAGILTVSVVAALLIPPLGILGAAIALLASSLVLALGYALTLASTIATARGRTLSTVAPPD